MSLEIAVNEVGAALAAKILGLHLHELSHKLPATIKPFLDDLVEAVSAAHLAHAGCEDTALVSQATAYEHLPVHSRRLAEEEPRPGDHVMLFDDYYHAYHKAKFIKREGEQWFFTCEDGGYNAGPWRSCADATSMATFDAVNTHVRWKPWCAEGSEGWAAQQLCDPNYARMTVDACRKPVIYFRQGEASYAPVTKSFMLEVADEGSDKDEGSSSLDDGSDEGAGGGGAKAKDRVRKKTKRVRVHTVGLGDPVYGSIAAERWCVDLTAGRVYDQVTRQEVGAVGEEAKRTYARVQWYQTADGKYAQHGVKGDVLHGRAKAGSGVKRLSFAVHRFCAYIGGASCRCPIPMALACLQCHHIDGVSCTQTDPALFLQLTRKFPFLCTLALTGHIQQLY
jgi:hypothetical protein